MNVKLDGKCFNASLDEIKRDIQVTHIECQKRGLTHSAVWLAELKYGLDPTIFNTGESQEAELKQLAKDTHLAGIADNERNVYDRAKGYFDLREYDRAAYFLQNAQSPVPKFLYLYSMYMGKEKRRMDNMTDKAVLLESGHYRNLSDLMVTLRSLHAKQQLDGYCLYLYGVVLRKLDLRELAVKVLVESIKLVPTLWCSYLELVSLLTDKDEIFTIETPNHWLKMFYYVEACAEFHLNDKAIQLCEDLQSTGFEHSTYLIAQLARVFHDKRSVEKALNQYQILIEQDPFRLEGIDAYSNLLFVRQMKRELSVLAQKASDINKYRPETCCIIGNYYSLRSDHGKAALYFQRALKLDPTYLSAWTLLGHEFMEVNNTNGAIQSYRKALEVNKREYRAWYGLGQTYEILKMSSYALYYYKIAQELQPYDSRMLIALGDTFEKVEQYANALKCYQRAYNAGDIEGITLLRMGNLYEKLEDIESAVPIYIEYCKDERVIPDKASLCRAYLTLGTYYERVGQYDEAAHYAYKCLEYDDVKAEAQELLDTIKNKRWQNQLFPLKKPEKKEEPSTSASTSTSTTSFNTTVILPVHQYAERYENRSDVIFGTDMTFGGESKENVVVDRNDDSDDPSVVLDDPVIRGGRTERIEEEIQDIEAEDNQDVPGDSFIY